MTTQFFQKPILNSPYRYPARHWELDEEGQPTDRIIQGRRSAAYVTPVPRPKKQKASQHHQEQLFEEGHKLSDDPQIYDSATWLINSIRLEVDKWRSLPKPKQWGVTPETERLLRHWRKEVSDGIRPFFCQIEAVETAIWLAEVMPVQSRRHSGIRKMIREGNQKANPALFRIALKMATGAGKTTVMAMLIAWQTVNSLRRPQSRDYSRGFLIVTPGITIRDRLRVLEPNHPENYYAARNLVPRDLLADLARARIVITNYHGFRYDERGAQLARPMTLLIDSEQLDSGDALDRNFREMAGDEIERFRRELVVRKADATAGEKLTDEDLLREVMNTVGKRGRLGESIRCVVSVSMLTEGWDAQTVTHILGVRAFGTQLLCEQVMGRALRRWSYDLNQEGLFDPEYADVFGIPFDFTAKPTIVPPPKPKPMIRVHAVRPDRDSLNIWFPRVEGYRTELPEQKLGAKFSADSKLRLTPDLVGPSKTRSEGIIGEGIDLDVKHLEGVREATVLFHLTKHLLYEKYRDPDQAPRLHLFGQLKGIVRGWLAECLVCNGTGVDLDPVFRIIVHVRQVDAGHDIGAVHVVGRENPPQMTRDEAEMEIYLLIPLQPKVFLEIPRMEKDHHWNHPPGAEHLRKIQAVTGRPKDRKPRRVRLLFDHEEDQFPGSVGPFHQQGDIQLPEPVPQLALSTAPAGSG